MKSRFRKIGFWIFLNLSVFPAWQTPCFAMPSKQLLIRLSRHAVDVRKNSLPVLITDETRNTVFLKVIRETLQDLEGKIYDGSEQDRATLSVFLKGNSGLNCRDCDETILKLASNLLFRGHDPDLGWVAHLGVDNPSYSTVLSRHPDVILNHDTGIERLLKILEKGRIGQSRTELAQKAPQESLEIFSHSLEGHGPTAFNGTFVQISLNQADLDGRAGFGQVRLILKNDLLKRWDFHASHNWPGGKFVAEGSDSYRSFGPGEVDLLLNYRAKQPPRNDGRTLNNELVFYNPIPLSEIREIQVSEDGLEPLKKILAHFRLSIPVRLNPLISWNHETARQVLNTLESGTEYGSTLALPLSPRTQETIGLQSIIEKILGNQDIRARFESFDPKIKSENRGRLSLAFQEKELMYLDHRMSTLQTSYDTKNIRQKLLELTDNEKNKDSFIRNAQPYFKIDGISNTEEMLFREPWMRDEFQHLMSTRPILSNSLKEELIEDFSIRQELR